MRGKYSVRLVDAALLRLAADDPVDVALERGERRGGAVGIGGLAVVDEQRAADAADLLQAMRQAGEGRERRAHSCGVTPTKRQAALAASAFWMLWRPRRGPMPARSANAPSGPGHGAWLISWCPPRTSRAPRARWPTARRPSCDWQAVSRSQIVAAPVVILADDGPPRAPRPAAPSGPRSARWCHAGRGDRARCSAARRRWHRATASARSGRRTSR